MNRQRRRPSAPDAASSLPSLAAFRAGLPPAPTHRTLPDLADDTDLYSVLHALVRAGRAAEPRFALGASCFFFECTPGHAPEPPRLQSGPETGPEAGTETGPDGGPVKRFGGDFHEASGRTRAGEAAESRGEDCGGSVALSRPIEGGGRAGQSGESAHQASSPISAVDGTSLGCVEACPVGESRERLEEGVEGVQRSTAQAAQLEVVVPLSTACTALTPERLHAVAGELAEPGSSVVLAMVDGDGTVAFQRMYATLVPPEEGPDAVDDGDQAEGPRGRTPKRTRPRKGATV